MKTKARHLQFQTHAKVLVKKHRLSITAYAMKITLSLSNSKDCYSFTVNLINIFWSWCLVCWMFIQCLYSAIVGLALCCKQCTTWKKSSFGWTMQKL